MKKFIFCLLAILLMCGIAFAKSPTLSYPGDILGQTKLPGDPHRIFRLVRYVPPTYAGAATTLAADSIVIWDLTSDDGVTITTTTTSADSAVAGIIALTVATPDAEGYDSYQATGHGNWTWLQTYGKAEVRISSDSAVGAGWSMGTGTTAGEAAPVLFGTSTASSTATDAAQQGKAGFFYDAASAAADDVECFLNID